MAPCSPSTVDGGDACEQSICTLGGDGAARDGNRLGLYLLLRWASTARPTTNSRGALPTGLAPHGEGIGSVAGRELIPDGRRVRREASCPGPTRDNVRRVHVDSATSSFLQCSGGSRRPGFLRRLDGRRSDLRREGAARRRLLVGLDESIIGHFGSDTGPPKDAPNVTIAASLPTNAGADRSYFRAYFTVEPRRRGVECGVHHVEVQILHRVV